MARYATNADLGNFFQNFSEKYYGLTGTMTLLSAPLLPPYRLILTKI